MRAVTLLLSLAMAACSTGPMPIAAGDPCARCHMPVADERWGAELITRTGLVRKYDAIECLARDLAESIVPADQIGSLWVVPADAPGTLVPAAQAVYVRGGLRSPMGLQLTAWSPDTDPDTLAAAHGAEVLTWEDVRAFVAETPGPHAH